MSTSFHESESLSFRISPEMRVRIERAAAARGLTLPDFAIITLMREAEEVLRANTVLVLSDNDRDTFLEALDKPPVPNAKALRAADHYKKACAAGEVK